VNLKPTELGSADVLPNCIAREVRGAIECDGMQMVPVFCGNCGCDSHHRVSAETIKHAFYLCEDGPGQRNCAAKWQHLAGTHAVPDEVFFERVKQAQLEKDGRFLSVAETVEALKDSDHYLSKLARDRGLFSS
jgi:hypothetical protein